MMRAMPTGVYERKPRPLADPLPRFFKYVRQDAKCWIWIGDKWPDGYGRFWAEGRNHRAHRWSYEHFVGQIPEGLNLCHACDTPLCVNPSCLWPGTQKENIQDAARKGRRKNNGKPRPGESNCNSKLTELQVREIRSSYQRGTAPYPSDTSMNALARKYGVSRFAIQCVIKRITWAHVQ
jgi:hypothetical protein